MKTYNRIIGNFQKTITDLERLQSANAVKLEDNRKAIADLQAECRRLEGESKAASHTVDSLTKLIK